MSNYNHLLNLKSDINDHLPTLKDLASECKYVTEMGVRYCVSTWAFLEGLSGGRLISIDIKSPEEYGGDLVTVINHAKDKNIDFHFILADTLTIDIQETDLLFIDTLHTYDQLKAELALHSNKARKYIALHDTTSCPDMYVAVEEFLAEHKEWQIKNRYTNCNGLTILQRC